MKAAGVWQTLPQKTFLLLTWRFCCLSSVQVAIFFSEEPEMPLSRSVSKVRHITGSGWGLAELTLDLWVTSHSNREPSSYPATKRGPEVESVWSRGRMIREKMKTKRREDVNAEWKALCGAGSWVEQRLSSWKLLLTLKDVVGSIHQPAGLFPEIHYTIAHFAPHLYYWPQTLQKEGTNPSFLF